MKAPLSWLREYVDIDISVDELMKRLTAIGHMQDKKPEKVGDDIVLDLEVRQNRSDCLSMLGIAREIASVTGKTVKVPSSKFQIPSNGLGDDKLKVVNTEPNMCYRFKAVRIKLSAKNQAPSTPSWMADRLTAYGVKTISPLVDITNYVMLEYGEPMHAFNASNIKDSAIIIRRAKDGEKLTILGGRELTLTPDDLVIADSDKILSFSGLIGGADTGVQDAMSEVVLEAATYNHAVIRRSSIRHSIRTEASTRHEKFLHPHLAEVALDRAVQLVLDICGGEVIATADSYPEPSKDTTIDLRISEISRLGGISLSIEEASKYLSSLGFTIFGTQHLALSTNVPYWRTDIEQEADLVEEVLRLHGYENIPSSLPSTPPPKDITSYWYRLDEKIRDIMLQFGFHEQITEPLTEYQSQVVSRQSTDKQIKLQNALNADKNALRTTLREGLVHAVKHQKKYGKETISLFELGKVYGKTSDSKMPYYEKRYLGFVIYDTSLEVDELYLRAKGLVEQLCFGLSFAYTETIAQISLVDDETVFCSISLEDVWGKDTPVIQRNRMLYSSIPHIQRFDISIAVDKNTPVGDIIAKTLKAHPEIDTIILGEKPRAIDTKSKTILLRFVLSDHSQDKDTMVEKISKYLVSTFQVTIR